MYQPGETPTVPTEPYDRGRLDEQLSDVGRYLAELVYVDGTTSCLDGWDDPRGWTIPPLGAFEQYDIEVGETYPFTRSVKVSTARAPELREGDPVSLDPYEHIKNDISGIKVAAARWGQDNLDSIVRMVQDITWEVPAIYQSEVIEPLKAAHAVLREDVRTDLGKLGYSVGHWRGDAASNFATNFYHPFKDMRVSQERVIEALVGGLVTAKAIDESAKHSLMNAVHYVREMILEQLRQRQQQGIAAREGREVDPLAAATTTIAILATGTGLYGAAVGAALWKVGIDVATAGLDVAATSIPEETTLRLAGQTADELLGALLEAIGTIKKNADSQYNGLADELKLVLSRVQLLRDGPDGDDGRLYPVRPQIVDGVDSKTFRYQDR